jgi:uncharacterized membrane protein
MTSDENKRIASLTTGAIKTTAGEAIKAMIAAVEAAEAKTAEMRAAVEEYVAEFDKAAENLAETVGAHVASCQGVIDSFQEHHLKILNVEPKPEPEPAAPVRVRPRAVDLDDVDSSLKALAGSAESGRR